MPSNFVAIRDTYVSLDISSKLRFISHYAHFKPGQTPPSLTFPQMRGAGESTLGHPGAGILLIDVEGTRTQDPLDLPK